MNRTIIALGLLACSTHIAAQDVNIYTPGTDEGIVYFLPKTALEVNIIATRISYQPGELCQYANRYLRMNNVNPQPETYWEIKQIDVRSIGVPDSTKAYIIKLKDKSTLSNIELTESGIAKAINTTFPKEYEQQQGYELEKPLPHESTRKYMTEEILMAGSTAKMAELTAKEIYNIRESKNLILRGQADTMPKDGASLKLIMDNLDKQEKALTQMFAGTTDREDKVFTVLVTPEDNTKDKIVLRFSRLLGALSTDNLAGDPIYISMNSTAPIPAQTDDSKYLTNEQVGTPSGLATLDANGKLTASQRPDVDAYTRKQTDDLVDQDVAAHNTDETAHGDIRASIAAVDAAVKAIELKYGTEITKNPFSVGFTDLSAVNVTGVWNASLGRIEF